MAQPRHRIALFPHDNLLMIKLKRAALAALLGSLVVVAHAQSATNIHWIDAWSAAPDSAGPALEAQTIRQIVRTSIGGSSVRIRLSNLFGAGPVTIGPVRIARHANGSAIQSESNYTVTFDGKTEVSIAKGAETLSDPVALSVTALEELAVTLYLPSGAQVSTIHTTAIQSAFMAAGDATAAPALPPGERKGTRYFLTDVQVAASADARALVIVGDSITDGVGSTPNRNARWPDALAERLQADPQFASIAVVNSGISGNRILNDGVAPYLGPSVLSRFDRDALSRPGVRWILLFEGINDISAPNILKTSNDDVTAQQIIEGMQTLISRAHHNGLKIWGATLLPFAGAKGGFHSAAGEVKRQAINEWIRASGAFDAVLDFDRAIRDPHHPDRILTAYDSGDHLHLNDAGYKALAALIDLHLLRDR